MNAIGTVWLGLRRLAAGESVFSDSNEHDKTSRKRSRDYDDEEEDSASENSTTPTPAPLTWTSVSTALSTTATVLLSSMTATSVPSRRKGPYIRAMDNLDPHPVPGDRKHTMHGEPWDENPNIRNPTEKWEAAKGLSAVEEWRQRIPPLNDNVISVIVSFVGFYHNYHSPHDTRESVIGLTDLWRVAQISKGFWIHAKIRRLEAFEQDDRNGELRERVREWCADKVGAEAKYGPISGWDVSRITSMRYFFGRSLKTNETEDEWNKDFDEDLSAWNVENVLDMTRMFALAKSFDGNLTGWNITRVNSMEGMFHDALAFTGIGLSGWYVGDGGNYYHDGEWNTIWDMKKMFYGALAFNADISRWNVDWVYHMYGIFHYASSFDRDTVKKWRLDCCDAEDIWDRIDKGINEHALFR